MKSSLSQDRVSAARVMVVGCGALGNEVLKNLVLMGVQHIVVVDFDVVEMGNLSRSVLFTRADAEARRLKVEVVAERLKAMNPVAEIQTVCGDIAYDVGLGLLRKMDVVIGCVDSRWARFCINRLCMRAGIPWVDGGIDGLEGTARVFIPGKNCYACNLGPEGLKDLARRMPCSGIIRRQEQAGSAPTTSIIASVIGAVQVQEALKLLHQEALTSGALTSLCGKMLYYDGEHLNMRLADFRGYDDDCSEHERWEPIASTQVKRSSTVAEALDILAREVGGESLTLCLTNDCFVDFVTRKDNDERTLVMCPGRNVEEVVSQRPDLQDVLLSGLYQHEYRHIDASFPYPELTLGALGIPTVDVLHVTTSKGDYYLEINKE